MKRTWIIVIVAVVAVAAAAGGIYLAVSPGAWQQVQAGLGLADPEPGPLEASGFIEAEEVDIASELGGRVVEMLAEEGEDVEAEQVLVRLDPTMIDRQIDVAQAALEMAEAKLAQAEAGARAEAIRQAEANVQRAEAARDGAEQAWQDAIALRDNPQELDARIAQARAEVAAAKAALDQAVALKDAAEIAYENYWDGKEALGEAAEKIQQIPEPQRPPLPAPPFSFHLIPNEYWNAWIGVNSAGARYDGARATLNNLYRMRNDPQQMEAQVDAAEAQARAAEAAARQAQAQLEALRAGASDEEIAAVEAQVAQAEATLQGLVIQRDKLTVSAPVGGLVLERVLREGELASPGATLLTLGDLDEVTLTIYVPENRLGQVQLGQVAEVEVDSFPDRVFEGQIVAIANEAEFTPRNVQTQEERVNMVFAVDIRIPNPDHALKPGLPADARIVTEEQ
jgi:multidrug efflux pump subunit AcrA (membrane-fusion protein)